MMINRLIRQAVLEAFGYTAATLLVLTQPAFGEGGGPASAGFDQGFYISDAAGHNSLHHNAQHKPR